jgi:hypothetical protein
VSLHHLVVCMGHSAFEDPTTPANAPKRESIEVRTMAFLVVYIAK